MFSIISFSEQVRQERNKSWLVTFCRESYQLPPAPGMQQVHRGWRGRS